MLDAMGQIERALEALARALGDVAVASVSLAGAPPLLEAARAGEALVGEERALYEGFRHPRRRAEFLAGRIAARRAAARALGRASGGGRLEIARDPSGAPCLKGHPALQLSISHSHDVAVAVAAPFAVGVDVEVDAPRPAALARCFFCAAERERLATAPEAERQGLVNLLWTRKEAASKVGRWGGRLPFATLDCSGETIDVFGRRIAVRSARAAGYAMSVAGDLGRG